ncbi:MAG TPA: hypothetical protein VGP72_20620 [Planctomycetota bacterium]
MEGENNVFVITKGSVKFSFVDGAKDMLQLSGTLPISQFFKPNDRKVTFLMGELKKEFTLDSKGKAADGKSRLKLNGKMKKGVFKATPVNFTLIVKGEPLLKKLEPFGFTSSDTNVASVSTSVRVLVDQLVYQTRKTFQYKATAGKSGSGR